MTGKNLRRQFFIKKEFQGKFILLYAGAIIFPAGVVTALLYHYVKAELERHLYSSHLKIGHTGEILSSHLLAVNVMAIFAIVILVMAVSLIVFSRLNRHFLRLENALHAMSRGDFNPRLLPPSRIQEITLLINMTEKTREDYGSRFAALAAVLDELERACLAQAPIERQKLRECADKLGVVLSGIELPRTETSEN